MVDTLPGLAAHETGATILISATLVWNAALIGAAATGGEPTADNGNGVVSSS